MAETKHVVMLASENDALKGGKVGGVGDVIRDLPRALAKLGWTTTVITPSYGFLHNSNPSKLVARVPFPFSGHTTSADVYDVTAKFPTDGVRILVVEHSDLRGTPIYFNDPPEHAFAQDAAKYALFCSAVGQYLKQLSSPFVIHLHDWHTGFLFLLRELHPAFQHLKQIRTVFTIHNLSIQGNRPIRGKYASVEQWFPDLFENPAWIAEWKDQRYKDPNFTPMAAGIQYADAVNTVSPTYAEEILTPSDTPNGVYGGEGLEKFLQKAKREHRLFGILNGSEYPADRIAPRMSFSEMSDLIVGEVHKWNIAKSDPLHSNVIDRMQALRSTQPSLILTSVTRVTEQKVRLFFETTSAGTSAMDEILRDLADRNGVYLFIGTGTTDYENLLTESFKSHPNFIYLKGYSDAIAQALYANGTIFMMPSSFEPCGIGQMVAMRDGQPCVVHAVGGLKDSVQDGVTGFAFSGETIPEQVRRLVQTTVRAMDTFLKSPLDWKQIVENARSARFTWEKSAQQYIELLYRG